MSLLGERVLGAHRAPDEHAGEREGDDPERHREARCRLALRLREALRGRRDRHEARTRRERLALENRDELVGADRAGRVVDRRANHRLGHRATRPRVGLHPGRDLGARRERDDLRDRLGHLERRRVATFRNLAEGAQNDGVEVRRDAGRDGARRRDLARVDAADERLFVRAVEETLADERLPEEDARRIDVDAAVEVFTEQLLRRHVGDLSLDLAFVGVVHAAAGLRDAEVEHAREAVDADHHVLGGHVAVHDRERRSVVVLRFVGLVEAEQEVVDDRARHTDRDAALGFADHAEKRGERLALDVLHDDEEVAAAFDDVERGDDVRVTEAGREARLVEEHRGEGRVLRVLRMHAFDRHEAGEPHRAAHPTEIDRGHTARRELAEELVPLAIAVLKCGHRHGEPLSKVGAEG